MWRCFQGKKLLGWKPSLSFAELIYDVNGAKIMQFIDLKSRHNLIPDKINTRIQKVMNHGQFILGPEVQELEQKLTEYTGARPLPFRVEPIHC